jgi:hypothetical protein
MADVSQNISAQLFVKELPTALQANFNGCKQEISPFLTTCVNNVDSDAAVENAFQKQLSLSEYYKSPAVFNTIKQDYMSKTMDSSYETQEVDLGPQPITGETGSQPPDVVDFVKTGNDTVKESFGSMGSNNVMLILIGAVILYFILQKK